MSRTSSGKVTDTGAGFYCQQPTQPLLGRLGLGLLSYWCWQWHQHRRWKWQMHVSSSRRKGRRQAAGPGAFWNSDLALSCVHLYLPTSLILNRQPLSLALCSAWQNNTLCAEEKVGNFPFCNLIATLSIMSHYHFTLPVGGCSNVLLSKKHAFYISLYQSHRWPGE